MDHSRIHIIMSKRNKEIILYDGYVYNIRNENVGIKNWRCQNRKCPGSIETLNLDILNYKHHNHEKDFDNNEKLYLLYKADKRALLTSEKARDIINNVVSIQPISIIRKLPRNNTIVDRITRKRNKNNITAITNGIPDSIKFTFSKELFLQFDSGETDADRVLIFTTETHLMHLNFCNEWYCDGTFKSCPRDFTQLYTIMGRMKSEIMPFAYFLMKNKSKNGYLKGFKFVAEKLKKHPEYITIDFEMSSFSGLNDIFPNTKIQGCFFHFNQILFRNIQKMGLTVEYQRNSFLREAYRMIISLSCVPIEEFEKQVELLDKYFISNMKYHEILSVRVSFKNIYCKKEEKNERPKNIFSVNFWSIHERILKDIPKTKNNLEGWHKTINSNFIVSHPSIYELGYELKKQHARVENNISKSYYTTDSTNSRDNNNQLKSILVKYNEYYDINYLKIISGIIKLKF
ncbi:hypothetical protein DMUE_2486 [Dictyocoela muelleri]|nr:hypothetical protein DMUE_2486 [Dictyocoela muelleri]